jgi:tRNA A-37 threonylcarbamoyl transferase component Bud32
MRSVDDGGSSIGRCQDTYRLARGRGTGYAVDGLRRAYLDRLINFPEWPLRAGECESVKLGRSSQLMRTHLPVAGRAVPVAYKRIKRTGWHKTLSDLILTHRALRAWHLGHALLRLGIATARPLAVIVPRAFDDADAFLATEWLEGAENLHYFCMRMQSLPERARHRGLKAAAASLGRLVAAMHSHQISHRDLKAANLLVREQPGRIDAYVVDLDGVVIRRSLSSDVRWRNLARLSVGLELHRCVSRTTRLRFVHAYLADTATAREAWKTLWRSVTERCVALSVRKQQSARAAA